MTHPIHHAKKSSVVLFPHTGLEEIQMKRVLSFFDAIILCIPWYMEPPPWIAPPKREGLIHVKRPEGAMKPEASFPSLLAEYRKWARENLNRGFTPDYGARWDPDSFIENTWKIRQTVRGDDKGDQIRRARRVLKWHLELHLARELEEMQTEAAALLAASHEKGSPLKVLFEGDLDDQEKEVSDSAFGLDLKQRNLSQILVAWFGLFETRVRENPLWLTWDEEVWNTLSQGDDGKTGQGEMDLTFRTQWPDLSCCHRDELINIKKRLFHREPFPELRKRVAHFGVKPSSDKDDLDRLMKEVDPFLPWGMSDSRIELQIRSISLATTPGEEKKVKEEKEDCQRTLVLLRRPSMKG
jgi:hypothetical protein